MGWVGLGFGAGVLGGEGGEWGMGELERMKAGGSEWCLGICMFYLGGLCYIFLVFITIIITTPPSTTTPHLPPGSKSVYPTSPRGVGGEGNHAGLKRGKEKNGTRRS